MGGFGGDWDTLDASIACADDAALAAVLAALGQPVTAPSGSLGLVVLADDGVNVSVHRSASGGGAVDLSIGAYVGPTEIAHAERVEAWLDAKGFAVAQR